MDQAEGERRSRLRDRPEQRLRNLGVSGPWRHLPVARHVGARGQDEGGSEGGEWGGGGCQRPLDTHLGVIVRIRMPMKRFFQSRNRACRDSVSATMKASVLPEGPG